MNPEDEKFVQSLNCWEDSYDVITDNIQKLSGLLSLQIQLLQNIHEEKEHQRKVRHMTLEEQNISRLLNSFEQRFNVELSKLTEFNNKLDTLLTGQQALITRVAQIEEKLANKEVTINSPILVKNEEGKEIDWSKILEPKIKIACKDEKGDIFTLEGTVQEDGSIICEPMTESRTIVGWSFSRDRKVYKQRLNSHEYVLVGNVNERNAITLKEPNKETAPWVVPSLYKRDWYVVTSTKNVDGNISPVYTSFVPSNGTRQVFVTKDKEHHVTGYLTDDGKAIYYDQYL